MERIKYETIDEYIATFDEGTQKKLNEIREIIKSVVPKETTEKISWDMPTFYLYGNLVHFAGFKHHIGFYPGSSGVENFLDKLTDYKTSKGAIQFVMDKPLPKALIMEIVKFRINENTAWNDEKKKK